MNKTFTTARSMQEYNLHLTRGNRKEVLKWMQIIQKDYRRRQNRYGGT